VEIILHDSWPIRHIILNPPPHWLPSRKTLVRITTSGHHPSVAGRHEVGFGGQFSLCGLPHHPAIRLWLPSIIVVCGNHFRTAQGQCGTYRKKGRQTDTDLCLCGVIQTMSHIVGSCPLMKLNGCLSGLHSTDDDVITWLTACSNSQSTY